MELKKKSYEIFANELVEVLEGLYNKHIKYRQGSFLFIMDQIKSLYDDFKCIYGHIDGDLLIHYVSEMIKDSDDRSAYALAYSLYYKFEFEEKCNSIIIKGCDTIADRYRALHIADRIYDLNISDEIKKIEFFESKLVKIKDVSIRTYLSNNNIKITKLKKSIDISSKK